MKKQREIIAHVIKQLHSVTQNIPQDGLFLLQRWFSELFNKAAVDRQAGIESIYVRSASLAKRLLATQRDVRVLHGDIHHYNIRQSSRGWLTFDPKGLVGERTYDCANTLCNPAMAELVHNETRLLTNAAILADTLALDLSPRAGVHLRVRLPKCKLVVTAHRHRRRRRHSTVASQCC